MSSSPWHLPTRKILGKIDLMASLCLGNLQWCPLSPRVSSFPGVPDYTSPPLTPRPPYTPPKPKYCRYSPLTVPDHFLPPGPGTHSFLVQKCFSIPYSPGRALLSLSTHNLLSVPFLTSSSWANCLVTRSSEGLEFCTLISLLLLIFLSTSFKIKNYISSSPVSDAE